MQDTPKGNRLHIAILGRRNAGKSSLINALAKQEVALVSDIPGTTTDPVYKAMEILPVGPVMLVDTAGIDDEGELGSMRVERSMQVLAKADVSIMVISADEQLSEYEHQLIRYIRKEELPVIGVVNKSDLEQFSERNKQIWEEQLGIPLLAVSAINHNGIEKLKQMIIEQAPDDWEGAPIIGDLLNPGDYVVLVVPIDLSAPKGRLILPQVQTIRDVLDHDAYSIIVKERELKETLDNVRKPPRIVVTDSQEFLKVAADTPEEVMLTSFSILFARNKGELATLVAGAKAIEKLKPGDRVLIAEACTHHRQADDIGKVKIPRWLRQWVGGELVFDWTSGGSFPEDLDRYQLIVHCGACMLTRRQMLQRLSIARQNQVPIVNYGVLIAFIHGILKRALFPFPSALCMLEE
ncbi:hypothetical protein P22_1861 [Propionispora sp. 2/2-37]|uniref:[FeFe] hydrogenase H-cluster maturation GTPase HydF n=1 Tax=Propionispora sp. 2/2-37 TaxID=1677858 RepID=UPI0006BB89D7|nr:[FeFe] hydrogenase H-cluster maturation GTPase HydF [Propionispora sp. 2/2-37]CUH95781.1 hypothetical protein P22_1861 [Propionispora sp. 2/2-37]